MQDGEVFTRIEIAKRNAMIEAARIIWLAKIILLNEYIKADRKIIYSTLTKTNIAGKIYSLWAKMNNAKFDFGVYSLLKIHILKCPTRAL